MNGLPWLYIKVVHKGSEDGGGAGEQCIWMTWRTHMLKSHDRPGESESGKRISQFGKVPSVILF